jgi:calcineurin-like phosphoesterase
VLSALTTGVPTNFDVATDDVRLRGALISVEAGTGRATSIEAIEFMATADG